MPMLFEFATSRHAPAIRVKNQCLSELATLLGPIAIATSVLTPNAGHLRHHVHQDIHRLLRLGNHFRHAGN